MFENIGSKLKGLAVAEVILGVIASIIYGFAVIADEMVLVSIIIIVVGSVTSWMGSWVTYGIGEAVENSEAILRRLRQSESEQNYSCFNNSGSSASASYSANPARAPQTAAKVAGADEWKCECGRVNKKYVTTCPCGKNRYR